MASVLAIESNPTYRRNITQLKSILYRRDTGWKWLEILRVFQYSQSRSTLAKPKKNGIAPAGRSCSVAAVTAVQQRCGCGHRTRPVDESAPLPERTTAGSGRVLVQAMVVMVVAALVPAQHGRSVPDFARRIGRGQCRRVRGVVAGILVDRNGGGC